MAKTHDFLYKVKLEVLEGKTDVKVLAYNTPYPLSKDAQTLDDIKYAVLNQKIINFEELEVGKRYEIEFICKFVEREEKVFDQFFELKKCEELVNES